MRKKGKNKVKDSDTSIYELFSEFKSPNWIPFPIQSHFHDVIIPTRSEVIEFTNKIKQNLDSYNLKTIYWYLLALRYLQIPLSEQEYKIYDIILDHQYENGILSGFTNNKLKTINEKKKKKKDVESPDIFSTFYALASLSYIGRLNEYLISLEGKRKSLIIKFVESLKKDSHIFHCIDPKCKICKETPETEIIFHIFLIYDLLDIHPRIRSSSFLPMLKNSKNKYRNNIFRLLSLRYLGSKTYIEEDDIIKLHKFQKSDGGFGDIDNTFWISQIFKAYEWLIPYQAGPIFSYLVQSVKTIIKNNYPSNDDQLQIIKVGKIVVLLTEIFELLANEVEELIFTNLPPEKVIDLNILSIHGGLKGAEEDIIKFINSKYSLTLEICNNEERFEDYLVNLKYPQKNIARKIYKLIKKESQIDIKYFCKLYNKGRFKKERIDENTVISLISDMAMLHFYEGRIYKKNRLFSTHFFFGREKFIDKVIVSNKLISYKDLEFEKLRLDEVSKNIFNMTNEMETSSQNIMHEVESLIIADQTEIAEERLRFNIKYNITKALFFEKNIQSFQEEFKIIRAQSLLGPLIEKWNNVYNNLQHSFSNISRILSIKITDLKEEHEQYQLTLELEKIVNQRIHGIIDEFDEYQKRFQSQLETNYSREIVKNLLSDLQQLEGIFSINEHEIQRKSLKITSKESEITNLRKKVIDLWISNLKEFQNSIHYYRLGFTLWNEKISLFDEKNSDIIEKLDQIKQNINNWILKKKYKQALSTIDKDFSQIGKEIEEFTQSLKKEIDKYHKKNRKLGPLIQNITTEWLIFRNNLENLSHDMQFKLQNSVVMDQKQYKIEMFRLAVEKQIITIRQSFIVFEKDLNSLIQRGKCTQQTFDDKYKKLTKNISDTRVKLKKQYSNVNKGLTEKQQEIEVIWKNWNNFLDKSDQKLIELKDKYLEDETLRIIFKYAHDQKTNDIVLFIIAKLLSQDELVLKNRIIDLINATRLNAILISDDPAKIELHNEVWRKYKRLEKYTNVIFRDLEAYFKKINQYYESSILHHQFLRDNAQIQTLISAFNEKLSLISEYYEKYLQQHQIDKEYELIKDNSQIFFKEIDEYRSIINNMKTACEKTANYSTFLNNKLKFLEKKLVNPEIKRLNQELQTRVKTDYKKNFQWLKAEREAFQSEMIKLSMQIEDYKKENEMIFPQTASVVNDLEKDFNSQKKQLIEKYHNAVDLISDKLSALNLKKLTIHIGDLIKNKQDEINHLLNSISLEIKNKIRSKDYLTVSKKINNFSQLEKIMKNSDKEIKSVNKDLMNKHKVWEIKSRFIMDEWERYLQDIFQTIKGQRTALQTELILQYTLFAVRALKGNYIPLNKMVQDLKIKHEVVQHSLMGLIGDSILSGQIDLNHDIYIETDDKDFDAETIAALDITKSTNVKFYLYLQRLVNIFQLIGPLLAATASILTIIFYLSKLPLHLVFILSPLITVLFIVILIWIRKGKTKAIDGSLNS